MGSGRAKGRLRVPPGGGGTSPLRRSIHGRPLTWRRRRRHPVRGEAGGDLAAADSPSCTGDRRAEDRRAEDRRQARGRAAIGEGGGAATGHRSKGARNRGGAWGDGRVAWTEVDGQRDFVAISFLSCGRFFVKSASSVR